MGANREGDVVGGEVEAAVLRDVEHSQLPKLGMYGGREFVDYKTSMITDEDPLRGLLFH